MLAPADPLTSTPRRAVPSVRRTTSVDIVRPDGMKGDVVLHGRARDLRTARPGQDPEIVGEAVVDARVRMTDRVLLELEVSPPASTTSTLLGRSVGSGFRGALDPAMEGTTAYVLLDDLPVAALIAGYANMRVDDSAGAPDMAKAAWAYSAKGDICSGWRSDGSMMTLIAEQGRMPVPECPPAPALEDPADPAGWHAMTDLPAASMRRRRRIDVRPADEGGGVVVDAMFRDSFWEADGTEVVLHEYRLDAFVDASGIIRMIVAEPRVLPWMECPAASGSASELVGIDVADLPGKVKQDLSGISTCTHLNDLFRSLRDVHRLGRLVAALPS